MLTRNLRLIILGAVVGAALGGTAGWAVSKIQDQNLPPELRTGKELSLAASAQQYVGLAVSLIAVIRNVVDLFRPV
jgi:ABC-type lipoprotein release transport system permease subunit